MWGAEWVRGVCWAVMTWGVCLAVWGIGGLGGFETSKQVAFCDAPEHI